MNLSISRNDLLPPLQSVCSVVESRPSLPILSNVLLSAQNNVLTLTGTDLEVEIIASIETENIEPTQSTFPAKKLLDICRTLPESAILDVKQDGERIIIRSGQSRFVLATLSATEFPNLDPLAPLFECTLAQGQLKYLIEKTQFAMAHQDVRYYLNGLLFEFSGNTLRTVATDGHRLAICEIEQSTQADDNKQIIVPRKGVIELARLLQNTDDPVTLQFDKNHIKATLANLIFTSKLIDGKFPDYARVIPEEGSIKLNCDRDALRQAFLRASVLSNEKYRGMRLHVHSGLLRATVQNPEQEEAEEELEIDYEGEEFEIGFNITYFLDALSAIDADKISISMVNADSSCLVQGIDESTNRYVIMPMRL